MTTCSVMSGHTRTSLPLRTGDFLFVSSAGTATLSTVSNGGSAIVLSGGSTSFTTLSDGGVEIVSGGTASFTKVSDGRNEIVSSGGTASFATVRAGGRQHVSAGGTAISTTVDSGGKEFIHADGTTSFTTVNDGGSVTVFASGTTVSAVVSNCGTEEVAFGTADFTALRGIEEVGGAGGTAGTNSTILSDGGTEYVQSDGQASHTTANHISRNVTKIVVTNHKTGTLLMHGIVREYCSKYRLRYLSLNSYLIANQGQVDPAFDFQRYDFIFVTHTQYFEKLVNAVPDLRYRAIHLIRNPYEIIMSGTRYHQITDEKWCNKRLFVTDKQGRFGFKQIAAYSVDASGEVGDHTYREIMNRLPDTEKVEFEIRNHRSIFGTIVCIERFLKRFHHDSNVTTVRLEDIATDECIAYVFEFLALNDDFADNYRSKVRTKAWLGKHVTNSDGNYTYHNFFNDLLYDLFASEFGSTIVHDFGYAPDSPLPKYLIASQASARRAPGLVEGAGSERPSAKSAGDILALPDQGSADELYAVGDNLLALGKLHLSKEAFGRSLARDGNRVSTLGRLGDVCVRLGEYEDALVYFERIGKLIEVKPAWVYIGLANAYQALKQKESAITNLRLALPLMQDSKVLQSRLEALETDGR